MWLSTGSFSKIKQISIDDAHTEDTKKKITKCKIFSWKDSEGVRNLRNVYSFGWLFFQCLEELSSRMKVPPRHDQLLIRLPVVGDSSHKGSSRKWTPTTSIVLLWYCYISQSCFLSKVVNSDCFVPLKLLWLEECTPFCNSYDTDSRKKQEVCGEPSPSSLTLQIWKPTPKEWFWCCDVELRTAHFTVGLLYNVVVSST